MCGRMPIYSYDAHVNTLSSVCMSACARWCVYLIACMKCGCTCAYFHPFTFVSRRPDSLCLPVRHVARQKMQDHHQRLDPGAQRRLLQPQRRGPRRQERFEETCHPGVCLSLLYLGHASTHLIQKNGNIARVLAH